MENNIILQEHEPVYLTHFSVDSSLNYGDPNRYCQLVVGTINLLEDQEEYIDKEKEVTIGRIKAYKILVDIAIENHENLMYVFDSYQETMEIGEEIYDFNHADFSEKVNKHYNYDLQGSNVLILSSIEILPEHRGKNVGRKAIKDLYNNFMSGCGLFASSCFPLQCSAGILDKDDPFTLAMQYDKMEQARAKAFKKLSDYFRSIGFETIPGVDKDIMVYNPVTGNEHFDGIILDQ